MALSRAVRIIRYGVTQPFRLHNTAMPAELVLIVRVVAFWIVIQNEFPFPVRTPIFEVFDSLPTFIWTYLRLYGLRVGILLIMFTPFIRVGSAIVGGLFLTSLFACIGCVSGAHTYMSFIFIMSALSSRQSGKILFKIQTMLVYLAATWSKGAEIGWWNGGYFEAMMFDRYQQQFYIQVAGLFPPSFLSTFMGIFVLGIEAAMVILLARRIWVGYAIILGVFFHTSITIMMGVTFGPFWIQIMLSYIAFLELPKRIDVRIPSTHLVNMSRKVLHILHAEHYYPIEQDRANRLSIMFDGREYSNLSAISFLLFTSLPIYYYLAIPFAGLMNGHTGRLIHIATAFVLLLPILIEFLTHKFSLWRRIETNESIAIS